MNAIASSVAGPASATAGWLDGLENLAKWLEQSQCSLAAANDRLFGPAPPTGIQGSKPQAVPTGRVETISDMIGRLTEMAVLLAETSSSLNERI